MANTTGGCCCRKRKQYAEQSLLELIDVSLIGGGTGSLLSLELFDNTAYEERNPEQWVPARPGKQRFVLLRMQYRPHSDGTCLPVPHAHSKS
jgi:hypothetical protein